MEDRRSYEGRATIGQFVPQSSPPNNSLFAIDRGYFGFIRNFYPRLPELSTGYRGYHNT